MFAPYIEPRLFYWQREEKGTTSEVDYVIQHQHRIIPIEVKAGTTGTLKSLHHYMGAKNLPHAIRINSDYPSKVDVKVKDQLSNPVSYHLY